MHIKYSDNSAILILVIESCKTMGGHILITWTIITEVWQKGAYISVGGKGVNIKFDKGCEFKEKGCDSINYLCKTFTGRTIA